MTFAEAIDCISKQEKCSPSEATRQMRTALADNEITGLCWEDQRSGMTAVLDSRPDYPPTDREFWQGEASIPDDAGRVFDRWTNRRRTLLVPKQSIFQIWPEPSNPSAQGESEQADPITKKNAGGRPSARDEIHQACDRLFQQGHRVKTMSLDDAAKLVTRKCGKTPTEHGWAPRTVKKNIGIWRALN
jgi:hypothetical protein